MKKIGIITMVVMLALAAAGCGCTNSSMPETTPSTTPATTAPATTAPATTAPTDMPDIPEFETNIPDPTVNDNSTENTTGMPDTTDATQDNARSRNRYHGK